MVPEVIYLHNLREKWRRSRCWVCQVTEVSDDFTICEECINELLENPTVIQEMIQYLQLQLENE